MSDRGKRETRTVSIKEENDRFLAEQDNASALVDDLVTQYRNGGDRQTAGIELQIQQKIRERKEAEDKVSRLDREIEELQEFKSSLKQHEDAKIEEAREKLGQMDDPTNPAVENWADKLAMTPEQLVEEL